VFGEDLAMADAIVVNRHLENVAGLRRLRAALRGQGNGSRLAPTCLLCSTSVTLIDPDLFSAHQALKEKDYGASCTQALPQPV
jgi:hypothetical protein